MSDAKLSLLHLDDELAVINKPAGLVVHPSTLCADRVSALKLLRNQLGRHVYAAHRLDRGTSGVLVFTQSRESAKTLGLAFAARAVTKSYLAVVRGYLPDAGEVEKDGEHTSYRTLRRLEMPWPVRPYATARYTLVELTPHTGKMHQLRRHMASLAHPIVGDTRYGDGAHNLAFRQHLQCNRLLLHAASLGLAHPVSGLPLRFEAPPDAAFAAVARLFR